jgi:hypothetical protein
VSWIAVSLTSSPRTFDSFNKRFQSEKGGICNIEIDDTNGRCEEWISDFTAFQRDLNEDEGYMSGLVGSMSLLLEEFYACLKVSDLRCCQVFKMDVDQSLVN